MLDTIKILAIDIGNTQCKLAVMQDATVLHKILCTHENLENDTEALCKEYSIDKIVVCNVVSTMQARVLGLGAFCNTFVVSHPIKLPFESTYESMQTLGLDRIALVAAAAKKFANQNTLVIALGTCITYNFIDEHNIFRGGAISPGMYMRFKAMHHFTKGLPIVEPTNAPTWIGTDTISCMQTGVFNGIVAELNGQIELYRMANKKLNVVLTGGNLHTFASQIKYKIFADENFQFYGLYEMLLYNMH